MRVAWTVKLHNPAPISTTTEPAPSASAPPSYTRFRQVSLMIHRSIKLRIRKRQPSRNYTSTGGEDAPWNGSRVSAPQFFTPPSRVYIHFDMRIPRLIGPDFCRRVEYPFTGRLSSPAGPARLLILWQIARIFMIITAGALRRGRANSQTCRLPAANGPAIMRSTH